jgi:hypothetical protein
MIAKLARLEFEFFTRPSKSNFLRVYQEKTPAKKRALSQNYLPRKEFIVWGKMLK